MEALQLGEEEFSQEALRVWQEFQATKQQRIENGFMHCFRNFYTTRETLDYMKAIGEESSVQEVTTLFLQSPVGRAYLRKSIKYMIQKERAATEAKIESSEEAEVKATLRKEVADSSKPSDESGVDSRDTSAKPPDSDSSSVLPQMEELGDEEFFQEALRVLQEFQATKQHQIEKSFMHCFRNLYTRRGMLNYLKAIGEESSVQEVMKFFLKSPVGRAYINKSMKRAATESKIESSEEAEVKATLRKEVADSSKPSDESGVDSTDMSTKPPDSDSSSVLPLSSASSNHANPYNEKSHQSILAIHQEMKEFMVSQGEIQKQLLHVVNEQAKQFQVAVKHITDTSSNVKAELASMIEKAITKRFSEIGPAISKAVKTDIEIMFRSAASSSREKIIELQTEMHMEMKRQVSNVINEQRKPLETAVERMKETVSADIKRGPSDKTVNQLDMIKETISREMKFYLETSGRQALKEFLKLGLESLVIPSLQNSCKTMVEQKERFDFDSRLASVVLASQDLCVEVAESRAKLSALPETASSLSELARSLRTKYTESAQP